MIILSNCHKTNKNVVVIISVGFKDDIWHTLSKLMNKSNPSKPTAEPAWMPMIE